ncbi:MAG: spore protease YyaC [Syntrophomonadaceae bacterium]|jgi:putative sporulation protein YyaC
MLLFKGHYSSAKTGNDLEYHLRNILDDSLFKEPIFLGIGSEHHILDCLGPLVGSMIKEKCKTLLAYGTLDDPLNAKNLNKRMKVINNKHPGNIQIAIDASLGSNEELGMIKLFQGSLYPGKAMGKRLQPVGHFYITGIVASHDDKYKLIRANYGSLVPVYHIARLISDSIGSWYNSYK